MKKKTFYIALLFCTLNFIAKAQLKINNCSKKSFDITYFNEGSNAKLFFFPAPFFSKKSQYQLHKNRLYLRPYRLLLSNDTAFVFLNDTSIIPKNNPANSDILDSYFIQTNRWNYNILNPGGKISFKAYFHKPIKYNYFVIYYNFDEKKKEKSCVCEKK